jgi:hypothetical protein
VLVHRAVGDHQPLAERRVAGPALAGLVAAGPALAGLVAALPAFLLLEAITPAATARSSASWASLGPGLTILAASLGASSAPRCGRPGRTWSASRPHSADRLPGTLIRLVPVAPGHLRRKNASTVTRPLYRSASSHREIRAWCERRLTRWDTPHQRAVVPTALGRTHLLGAGHGDTTVLYLAGTNFNAATSLPLLTALASEHRVVAADVPGQPGLSASTRPAGDRMTSYGAWVGELVEHLGTDRLVLMGHSLGAAIALAAQPAGVAGLVLVDPAGLIRCAWARRSWRRRCPGCCDRPRRAAPGCCSACMRPPADRRTTPWTG